METVTKQVLLHALCSAFNQSTMERTLKFELGDSMDDIVSPGNRIEQFSEIIEYYESENRMEEFIEAMRTANPGNEDLKRAALMPVSEQTDQQKMADYTNRKLRIVVDQEGHRVTIYDSPSSYVYRHTYESPVELELETSASVKIDAKVETDTVRTGESFVGVSIDSIG